MRGQGLGLGFRYYLAGPFAGMFWGSNRGLEIVYLRNIWGFKRGLGFRDSGYLRNIWGFKRALGFRNSGDLQKRT